MLESWLPRIDNINPFRSSIREARRIRHLELSFHYLKRNYPVHLCKLPIDAKNLYLKKRIPIVQIKEFCFSELTWKSSREYVLCEIHVRHKSLS